MVLHVGCDRNCLGQEIGSYIYVWFRSQIYCGRFSEDLG